MSVESLSARTGSSFACALSSNAAEMPGDLAFWIDGRPLSWRELYGRACTAAAGLDDYADASCVGLLVKDAWLFICCFFGSVLSRKVVVPLPPNSDPSFVDAVARDCSIDLLISDQQFSRECCPTVPATQLFEGWTERFRASSSSAMTDRRLLVSYSSGSTSVPKGIVHTERAFIASARMQAAQYDIDRYSHTLITAPLYTGRAIAPILSTMIAGGTSVVMSKYETEVVLEALEEWPITSLALLPFQFRMLIDHPRVNLERARSCDFIICGGTALDADLRTELFSLFPSNFVEIYGSTESNLISMCPRHMRSDKRGSVGVAAQGVKLLTLDESDSATSGEGEIVVASFANMSGYLNVGEEEKCWYVDDRGIAYVRTGDIGYIDGDGYLWITGRKKDMIKVAGFSVFPNDVEAVLRRHPLVADAAAVGKQHPVLGEVPFAFVVLRNCERVRMSTQQQLASEIWQWANSHLGTKQMLHGVSAIDALPRSGGGKVSKHILRGLLAHRQA